mmetsp:Transcript_4030/g.9969  ORF Transcript_4030/g.9969 Transcript_4030/m.9969 type:complete len:92 (+) Transcript_4030:790-1065(+)
MVEAAWDFEENTWGLVRNPSEYFSSDERKDSNTRNVSEINLPRRPDSSSVQEKINKLTTRNRQKKHEIMLKLAGPISSINEKNFAQNRESS